MTKEELLKGISSLVEKYEGQGVTITGTWTPDPATGKWKPEDNEGYWFVDSDGKLYTSFWEERIIDTGRYNQGNVFRTEEEALAEAKRRESMAKRHEWRPLTSDRCWIYHLYDEEANDTFWYEKTADLASWYIGNVHKTKEEAEEWGRNYAEYFK